MDAFEPYGERWRARQRIGQLLLVSGLGVATVWSWFGVPELGRGAVAIRSLAIILLATVFSWGVSKVEVIVARSHSHVRRAAMASALLPVAVAVAFVLRAVILDEAFEEPAGRTLILAAILGVFTSLLWLYRENNGLVAPRAEPPFGSDQASR